MDQVKNPMLAPNKTVAVVSYFLLTLLGGGFLIIIISLLYNKMNHIGFTTAEVLEIVSQTDLSKLEESQHNIYVFSNAIGNFLMYLIMFVIVLFFMRDHLIEDAKQLKANYKKLLWLIPVCAGVGYGISYGFDALIQSMIHTSSMNQSSIETLILKGGGVYMFFAVVLFAPIVEELIYRKAIFEYLKKFPIALSYIVSILLFTLPHVVTTFMEESYSLLENFLITLSYMMSGLLLCITYHLCHKNIYASWFFHFVNNLVSFILIVRGGAV